ncbi:MAG TPA: outer membrane beta-barrel protein [Longimicrobium sp.]|nr:outer membrane beta-barrel protein [Longimicrobium sp.]
MRKASFLIAAAVLAAFSTPLSAQSGFALKGHYLFNESEVKDGGDDVPSANGFSLGAELLLPFSVAVGVSGYTTGSARDFDVETSSFGVLAEANYFLDLPIIPLTPYAGIHAGLGSYTIDQLDDQEPSFKDGRTQLGWQVGVRWQLSSLLGLDAQLRRVSDSAADDQAPELERRQVLVGITVF